MALLEHKGYRRNEQIALGSKFLISNGYLGYRGTLDEADSSSFVAVNLNGLFDGNVDLETVNAYNPLYVMIKADGINLNPESFRPKAHVISLDTDNGVFRRKTEFKYGDVELIVKSERFIDQNRKNLFYSRYMFKSNKAIEIELYSGIDTFIWNINDIHFKEDNMEKDKNSIFIHSKTKNSNIDVCVGLMEDRNFDAKDEHKGESVGKFTLSLEEEEVYIVYKYAGVIHSESDGVKLLKDQLKEAKELGFDKLYKENEAFWEKVYDISRVNIYSNTVVKNQIDYAVYQLISNRPYSDEVSIPHTGLSGQFNSGVSWDAEIMALPFFINTDTISARHMVMYRIKGLKEAMLLAEERGFQGAMYPELSGPSGVELNRMSRGDIIHINASIIYGIYQYIERTADYSVLFEGGLEMLLESARFYVSFSTLSDNGKHYDFLKVQGLDEAHGHIDNEAYTNQMIKNALDAVIKCVAFAKSTDKNEVKKIFDENNYDKLIDEIRELRRRLYTKKELIDYRIEAFDGYLNLEDKEISTLKKIAFIETTKKMHMRITSYVQSANVLVMLALFNQEYSAIIHSKNYDYYMRRTVNPNYFARIMYIIEACEVNLADDAYEMFLNVADLSIENIHLFNKGLNMSLLGGLYLAAVYGFAGVKHYTYLVSADYNSPMKIRRIEFKLRVIDNIAHIKIKRNSAIVNWRETADDSVDDEQVVETAEDEE